MKPNRNLLFDSVARPVVRTTTCLHSAMKSSRNVKNVYLRCFSALISEHRLERDSHLIRNKELSGNFRRAELIFKSQSRSGPISPLDGLHITSHNNCTLTVAMMPLHIGSQIKWETGQKSQNFSNPMCTCHLNKSYNFTKIFGEREPESVVISPLSTVWWWV